MRDGRQVLDRGGAGSGGRVGHTGDCAVTVINSADMQFNRRTENEFACQSLRLRCL